MKYRMVALRIVALLFFVSPMAWPAGPVRAEVLVGSHLGKTAGEIRQNLEQQGYRVGDIDKERGLFVVEASLEGKDFEIEVDPKTGEIVKIGEDD